MIHRLRCVHFLFRILIVNILKSFADCNIFHMEMSIYSSKYRRIKREATKLASKVIQCLLCGKLFQNISQPLLRIVKQLLCVCQKCYTHKPFFCCCNVPQPFSSGMKFLKDKLNFTASVPNTHSWNFYALYPSMYRAVEVRGTFLSQQKAAGTLRNSFPNRIPLLKHYLFILLTLSNYRTGNRIL